MQSQDAQQLGCIDAQPDDAQHQDGDEHPGEPAPEEQRPALAYLGKVSGCDEPDKIAKAGLTVESLDGAPAFAQAETTIVCRPLYAGRIDPAQFLDSGLDAKWYPDKDYHIVYVAEVESIHTR